MTSFAYIQREIQRTESLSGIQEFGEALVESVLRDAAMWNQIATEVPRIQTSGKDPGSYKATEKDQAGTQEQEPSCSRAITIPYGSFSYFNYFYFPQNNGDKGMGTSSRTESPICKRSVVGPEASLSAVSERLSRQGLGLQLLPPMKMSTESFSAGVEIPKHHSSSKPLQKLPKSNIDIYHFGISETLQGSAAPNLPNCPQDTQVYECQSSPDSLKKQLRKNSQELKILLETSLFYDVRLTESESSLGDTSELGSVYDLASPSREVAETSSEYFSIPSETTCSEEQEITAMETKSCEDVDDLEFVSSHPNSDPTSESTESVPINSLVVEKIGDQTFLSFQGNEPRELSHTIEIPGSNDSPPDLEPKRSGFVQITETMNRNSAVDPQALQEALFEVLAATKTFEQSAIEPICQKPPVKSDTADAENIPAVNSNRNSSAVNPEELQRALLLLKPSSNVEKTSNPSEFLEISQPTATDSGRNLDDIIPASPTCSESHSPQPVFTSHVVPQSFGDSKKANDDSQPPELQLLDKVLRNFSVCTDDLTPSPIDEISNEFSLGTLQRRSSYDQYLPSRSVQSLIAQFERRNISQKFQTSSSSSIFYIGDDHGEMQSRADSLSSASITSAGQVSQLRRRPPTELIASDSIWWLRTMARCSRCWGAEGLTTALSVLSFAGTLGNLLRLPRMVYFHGGGVFLLVYVLITLVFGIPLTFLEIGLGQFCQHGTTKLWRAVNLFRGVGYAKAFISFALAISYSTQIASALALLAYSANGPLPFAECEVLRSASENGSWTMAAPRDSQARRDHCLGDTVLAPAWEQPMWFGIRFVFLLLLWALVLICVMKRSVTYRRTMYFLFPGFFGLMAALLVEHSSTTSAAIAGLDRLFTFDWAALGDVQVWYFATVQMFFSLQVGFGNISTCAGRIYPKSNAFWTAICLVGSSLVMGMASVILAYLCLGALDSSGPEFPVPEAFVLSLVYQVSAISSSALWASLAYLLVLVAGLSSLIALTYTVLVAAAVETKRRWRWRHINAAICLSACLLATASLIPGELSMSHVVEHYLVARGVMALTVLELVGFGVVYGCSNLYNDLEFVIGSKLSSAWRSLWLVTPIVLCVIELCSLCLLPMDREYGQDEDPLWQMALGWALYGLSWLLVLVCAVHQICVQVDYNLPQKLVSAMKPSRNWGPVDPIYRHCWVQWRNRYHMTGARDFTLKRRGTRDYTHHARTATPAKADIGTDSLQWPQSRH